MKKKFIKYTSIGLSLFSIFFILNNNKIINKNVIYAVNLWISKVFPSLFPMFVLNEILINFNFPDSITKLFKNCKINTYVIYVFIMSIFSGTPTNAIILKNLVENNEISSKEASYILAFSFFCSPVFLITILSNTFSFKTIIKIILIHYIANIIIFFIFKNKISKQNTIIKKTKKEINISKIINESIKKSINTLITILGTITFYIIISTIVINCFNTNSLTESLMKGILEITQGLNLIHTLNCSAKTKEIIAISIISFGGFSIHSQVQNIIDNTNISYKPFLIGRIIHTILSIIFIILF